MNELTVDTILKKYIAIDSWLNSAQGSRVSTAFASELSSFKEQLYGNSLLQLGGFRENNWLNGLHYYRKWLVTPHFRPSDPPSLISSLTALSLDRNSMDCIIAPLTIELFPQQKKLILDEIDRILKPMGYVVFWGINPWSVWGASLKWGKTSLLGSAINELTSSFSIKRAFLNQGYNQCAHISFYYVPPVKNAEYIKKLEFFNEVGKMLWPFPAGFYCLILQKRQYSLPGLTLDIDSPLVRSRNPSIISSQWQHEE